MIKVTDLMVGDYVNYRPGWINEENGQIEHESGTGFPVKIDFIYKATDGEGLVQYNDGENNGIEAAEYELFPIPLTPEILEKNGFRPDGSGQKSYCLLSAWGGPGIRHNIYVGLKRKTIDVYATHPALRTANWRKANKIYLEVCGCYVHELQRALKLCKIDKEITL